METKEIKITPPEGYEIDKENSTFECIKFKPKSLTYEDIAKKLFTHKCYCTNLFGAVCLGNIADVTRPNNATSIEQLEKLLAINKLLNVSVFLNDGWKPDWNDVEAKWCIKIEKDGDIDFSSYWFIHGLDIYFKTKELAQQAIDILGEDTIRLALSTDWWVMGKKIEPRECRYYIGVGLCLYRDKQIVLGRGQKACSIFRGSPECPDFTPKSKEK